MTIGDFLSPALQDGEIATHVANGGDAIRDQEREKSCLAPFRIGRHAGEVHVHVAQTRDEKFSAAINHARIVRRRRLADARDAIA